MAWTFSGTLLDGAAGDRVVAGTGEPEELPGRYPLAGLVDALCLSYPFRAGDPYNNATANRERGVRLREFQQAGH